MKVVFMQKRNFHQGGTRSSVYDVPTSTNYFTMMDNTA